MDTNATEVEKSIQREKNRKRKAKSRENQTAQKRTKENREAKERMRKRRANQTTEEKVDEREKRQKRIRDVRKHPPHHRCFRGTLDDFDERELNFINFYGRKECWSKRVADACDDYKKSGHLFLK